MAIASCRIKNITVTVKTIGQLDFSYELSNPGCVTSSGAMPFRHTLAPTQAITQKDHKSVRLYRK